MRALHVIPAVATRYGGPSTAIGPMCQALADVGVDALLVSTDADGPGRLDVRLDDRTLWQGVPTMFFGRSFSESFKYSRDLARWLSRRVGDFDVVHIHAVMSHVCLAAAAAAYKARVPYVLRPLGTLAAWSLEQKAMKKRLLLRLVGRSAILRASAIHCTSAEERRGVERAFPGARAVVIPLGIDSAGLAATPVTWTDRDRSPYVLTLSRLHPKKNLEALIRAFAEATDAPPLSSWRLVVAGTGDASYVSSLERLCRDTGLDGRVELVGWADGERKRDLVQRASLFATASFHENFGVSLLEALAAGVPGLVSRHVDLADEVRDAGAGWIVDTDVNSLRAGLTSALGDRTALEARGVEARRMAERYAWPGIASEIVALYRHCIDSQYASALATSFRSSTPSA